jgi:hypothetical protein
MKSEFLIDIRKICDDENIGENFGLLFFGQSLQGEMMLDKVARMKNELELDDLGFVVELMEKYLGVEVSMLEPNFGICFYEYLRLHGIDELLLMCVESLSVGLEDEKVDLFTQELHEFAKSL